jgi:hypothetical protein
VGFQKLADIKFTALSSLCALLVTSAAFAQSAPCDTGAFRAVVSDASASIVSLHEKNGRLLQNQLQKLRAAYGWNDAEFAVKAAPYVKDDVTISLDEANQLLLAKIQSFNAADAASSEGRCAMLGQLKILMQRVVENTNSKWEHMLDKASRAPEDRLQAGMLPR